MIENISQYNKCAKVARLPGSAGKYNTPGVVGEIIVSVPL
jgi:hypothetical protein